MLPDGWKKTSFANICIFQNGDRGKNYPSKSAFVDKGAPFVNAGHLTNGRISFDNMDYITQDSFDLLSSGKFEKGDFLFCLRGSLGKFAFVETDSAGAIASSLIIIRPKSEVCSDYVRYYLSSHLCYQQISDHKNGAAQPNLSAKSLKEFIMPVPSLQEQESICDVLNAWEASIDLTHKHILEKQKQKKVLMQRLLTGKHRFPQFAGQEWKEVELRKILKESRIPDNENDPKKRLTVKLHLKGVIERDYRGNEAKDATAYFQRKAGQIIYGKQNLFRGAIGIIPPELDGFSSSQDIPAFDVQEEYDVEWIYHYFSRPHFYENLEAYSSGSGSKRVQPKILLKHKILCPTIEEQQKIATVLNTADKEIDLLKQKLEAYKEQKKGLMQQLLTGKKRVNPIHREAT